MTNDAGRRVCRRCSDMVLHSHVRAHTHMRSARGRVHAHAHAHTRRGRGGGGERHPFALYCESILFTTALPPLSTTTSSSSDGGASDDPLSPRPTTTTITTAAASAITGSTSSSTSSGRGHTFHNGHRPSLPSLPLPSSASVLPTADGPQGGGGTMPAGEGELLEALQRRLDAFQVIGTINIIHICVCMYRGFVGGDPTGQVSRERGRSREFGG